MHSIAFYLTLRYVIHFTDSVVCANTLQVKEKYFRLSKDAVWVCYVSAMKIE